MGDVYASTEYRQHLATVMSRRALVKAYGRAAGTAALGARRRRQASADPLQADAGVGPGRAI